MEEGRSGHGGGIFKNISVYVDQAAVVWLNAKLEIASHTNDDRTQYFLII